LFVIYIYITIDMLYTLHDELHGGARRRAPVGPTAKEKAEELKEKIRNNDADFLETYMQYGYEKARLDTTVKIGNKYEKMLEIVRKHMDEQLRTSGHLGVLFSEEVAMTVTLENVKRWLRRHNDRLVKERKEDAERKVREQREEAERKERKKQEKEDDDRSKEWEGKSKDDIIKNAYDLSRGSLAATLKRARLLTSTKITMDDVKKWRLENTNKEKKTDKKAFNSWVANTRKEEYQVDLFFFQDLKKKLAMKELLEERAKGGDEEARAALDTDIPVPDAYALTEATGGASPKQRQSQSCPEEYFGSRKQRQRRLQRSRQDPRSSN